MTGLPQELPTGNEAISRVASLIAEASLRHLEKYLPEDLRQDAEFMDDILRASRAALERRIHRQVATMPDEPGDPRLNGPPREHPHDYLNDLDPEERIKASMIAERTLSSRNLDESFQLAAWEWAHDEAIRIVAERRKHGANGKG